MTATRDNRGEEGLETPTLALYKMADWMLDTCFLGFSCVYGDGRVDKNGIHKQYLAHS